MRREQADRAGEVAARVSAVEARVATACRKAGRRRAEVTIIAVTKGFPVQDILTLAALGVRDFGENRDQEARVKAAEVGGVRWHFVGRLQRNKCRSVATYADAVHSLDRPELVAALDDAAGRAARFVDVLVQASLDGQVARGGAAPADLPALAAACAAAPQLRFSGLMAVAPRHGAPDEWFAQLARLAADLRRDHPRADAISAGMSEDFEAAIRHGATHVRIGTALLGGREPTRR
ncbi:MAG: YggS family pyridoxal phosphate-dependent enzyme [Actinomycetota bacterium]|nr:YggS family pyridoxal phosphate-dependent enzyme [Actinomycetota bacterium]